MMTLSDTLILFVVVPAIGGVVGGRLAFGFVRRVQSGSEDDLGLGRRGERDPDRRP